MPKGLRLTDIMSDGLKGQFHRYQLSEHEIVPQYNRPYFWLPGRIIHHLRTWHEASIYFMELSDQYVDHDLVLINY